MKVPLITPALVAVALSLASTSARPVDTGALESRSDFSPRGGVQVDVGLDADPS